MWAPIRIPWSKYLVPKVVMEEEHYPPHLRSGGFLLSRFRPPPCASASTPWTSSPSMMSSGHVPEAGGPGARLTQWYPHGWRSVPSSRLSSFDPCFYPELLLVHRFLPYEMLLMWDALNQPNLTCGRQSQVY